MGKTHRRNPLDEQYGCFEGYYERYGYSIFGRGKRVDDEAAINLDLTWERRHWNRRRRDGRSGHYSYRAGGGKKLFGQLSTKLIRTETRRAIHRGITDGDWDDIVFPTSWDGKQFIWTVW